MKDSEGKKKRLHIQDVYQMLSTFIINDVKTLLGLEQKLAQMYMILNTNPFMTKENAYFLEEEKQMRIRSVQSANWRFFLFILTKIQYNTR